MNTIIAFKNEIYGWLEQNNLSNINKIQFKQDFSYVPTEKILNIGVKSRPASSKWFEEFLVKNGCQYTDIPFGILAFLHEVGHSQTVDSFDLKELIWCNSKKEYPSHLDDMKQSIFDYWRLPDEWAANQWLINFVNSNIETITDLWEIFDFFWEQMLEKDNLWGLVMERGEV